MTIYDKRLSPVTGIYNPDVRVEREGPMRFACTRCGGSTPDVDPDGRCLRCPSVADEPHAPEFGGSYMCRVCGRYASDRLHNAGREGCRANDP